MRLRELSYPIAVIEKNRIMGGVNAGLGSASCWNSNVPEYYQKGGYHDAQIVDSAGRKFEVISIELLPLRFIDKLYSTFITEGPASKDANIDMELREIHQYGLDEFCVEMRELALDNPDWWKRHSSRDEIESMFKGCGTFAEAINDIGILDGPKGKRVAVKSSKVRDCR